VSPSASSLGGQQPGQVALSTSAVSRTKLNSPIRDQMITTAPHGETDITILADETRWKYQQCIGSLMQTLLIQSYPSHAPACVQNLSSIRTMRQQLLTPLCTRQFAWRGLGHVHIMRPLCRMIAIRDDVTRLLLCPLPRHHLEGAVAMMNGIAADGLWKDRGHGTMSHYPRTNGQRKATDIMLHTKEGDEEEMSQMTGTTFDQLGFDTSLRHRIGMNGRLAYITIHTNRGRFKNCHSKGTHVLTITTNRKFSNANNPRTRTRLHVLRALRNRGIIQENHYRNLPCKASAS
jgi:hypothetical protein